MSTEPIPLDLTEWPYPDQADAMRQRLKRVLQGVQEEGQLSLARLEGITVVENLAAALGAFDAGHDSDHAATMRDTVVGRMIMTRRDGEIRGHIFFPIDAALQILHADAPLHHSCTYMLVHECAHVHDLERRVTAMPAEVLSPPLSQPLSLCLQITWNEYAACRLAAYSYPDQMADMKESLRIAIAGLRNARLKTRDSFAPTEEGRQKALTTGLNAAAPFLQAFSYLLGHCRGLSRSLFENVPDNYRSLEEDAKIADALRGLEQALDALWDAYGVWQNFQIFDELLQVICRVVRVTTGLVMKRREGRLMEVGLWTPRDEKR